MLVIVNKICPSGFRFSLAENCNKTFPTDLPIKALIICCCSLAHLEGFRRFSSGYYQGIAFRVILIARTEYSSIRCAWIPIIHEYKLEQMHTLNNNKMQTHLRFHKLTKYTHMPKHAHSYLIIYSFV